MEVRIDEGVILNFNRRIAEVYKNVEPPSTYREFMNDMQRMVEGRIAKWEWDADITFERTVGEVIGLA